MNAYSLSPEEEARRQEVHQEMLHRTACFKRTYETARPHMDNDEFRHRFFTTRHVCQEGGDR